MFGEYFHPNLVMILSILFLIASQVLRTDCSSGNLPDRSLRLYSLQPGEYNAQNLYIPDASTDYVEV